MVANSAVRLNGFWMHGRDTPGTRSIMSGWPDIRMTGTPLSSAIGTRCGPSPPGRVQSSSIASIPPARRHSIAAAAVSARLVS